KELGTPTECRARTHAIDRFQFGQPIRLQEPRGLKILTELRGIFLRDVFCFGDLLGGGLDNLLHEHGVRSKLLVGQRRSRRNLRAVVTLCLVLLLSCLVFPANLTMAICVRLNGLDRIDCLAIVALSAQRISVQDFSAMAKTLRACKDCASVWPVW